VTITGVTADPHVRRDRGGDGREIEARRAGQRRPVVGVIGGSGLYELEGLQDARWVKDEDALRRAVRCLSRGPARRRHGDLPEPSTGAAIASRPSEINYRANIYGLKALGARW